MLAMPGLFSLLCAFRSAAFRPMNGVGFPPGNRGIILKSTTIPISGLNTDPASSPSAASDARYRVCLCGRLPTCRLHFSRVGLTLYDRLFSRCRSKLRRRTIFRPYIPNAEASLAGGIKAFTHWATLSNFTGLRPLPTTRIYLGTIRVKASVT